MKRTPVLVIIPVFLALCYWLFLSSHLNSITIELDIDADEAGMMQVFWPDNNNRYSPSRFKKIFFAQGSSTISTRIPSFNRKMDLRLDPDNKQNRIRILAVRLDSAGHRVHLQGKDLENHISNSVQLDHTVKQGAIELHLSSQDPKLFLSRLPLPSSRSIILLGIASILVIFLVTPCYRLALLISRSWMLTSITFAILVLFHIYYSASDIRLTTVPAILAILGALVVAITALKIPLPARNEATAYTSGYLIAGTFITIIFTFMANSLSVDTLNLIRKEAGTAYSKKSSEGQNMALKAIIASVDDTYTKKLYRHKDLVNINSESKIFLFGFSPTDKAIVGKDNWFFEGYGGRRVEKDIVRSFDNITDYMGLNPFSQQELEAWRIALEERYYWLKEKGIGYVFALAPTKALVYPEKLPEKIYSMKIKLDRKTRFDQLIDYLQRNSIVPFVDLRKALLEEKHRNPKIMLFYRTDFHWNYYGSLIAYRAIINGINKYYPDYQLVPAQPEDFVRREKTDWVHTRFMNMLGLDPSQHHDDTYMTLIPKPGTALSRVNDYGTKGISDNILPTIQGKLIGHDVFGLREIDNPDAKHQMMFVIGDSFIEKTLGYFSKHAKRILNFRVVTSFPTSPYTVMDLHPDIVVQEILNMYLLQPPPTNPPELKDARIRAMR